MSDHDAKDLDDAENDGAAREADAGDGVKKPGGLGSDGTIPNEPDGIAAGFTGTASNFNPEEDEQAE